MTQWKFSAYREFWDVPRMVVGRNETGTYLFYSPFDEQLDDYVAAYHVYRMPDLNAEDLKGSWVGLELKAIERLPDIPIRSLPFDVTSRTLQDFDSLFPHAR
jgi:hypothetical protein